MADDVDEPILVFAGEISVETKRRIQAQFDAVRALFGDRFGDPPADYTIVVAADHAAAASTAPDAFGEHVDTLSCALAGSDYSVEILMCDPELLAQFTWQHFTAVVDQLAPSHLIPAVPEGPYRRAPLWFSTGLLRYLNDAARAVLGVEPPDNIRRSHTERASRTVQSLRSLVNYADMEPAGWCVWDSLAFLAADWLAQRAGEPALFEYYRLLPSSATWQDAFESAFGITIDDFYQEFAEYRAAGFEG